MRPKLAWHIAVPTYRRPAYLRRALSSLVSQDTADWRATVFDDSPDQEGRQVVAELDDSRICYVANPSRLGAAVNIDACFGRDRLPGHCVQGNRLQGLGLGFVLEDDNFLLPGFLKAAGDDMARTGAWMALFNQRIWSEPEGLAAETSTTRGEWFVDGWVSPLDLHASLLLMEGLSNGGIVWRLDGGHALEVGRSVPYTSLHEACRSLLVNTEFWFSSRALLAWTANTPAETARKDEVNRQISRGRQTVTRAVLRRHGRAAVHRAVRWCRSEDRRRQLIATLLHAGCLRAAWSVDPALSMACLGTAAKGVASRLWVKDPCAAFEVALGAASR